PKKDVCNKGSSMMRFRPLPKLTFWFVIVFALLNGLGVWQLQRLQWKENLIATVEARIHAAPVPLHSALAQGDDAAEWRPVSGSGTFLNDHEVYQFSQSKDGGIGAEVITPMRRADGEIVLIDRGFVPDEKRDPDSRREGQIGGFTTVTGVLRLDQAPGWFTP